MVLRERDGNLSQFTMFSPQEREALSHKDGHEFWGFGIRPLEVSEERVDSYKFTLFLLQQIEGAITFTHHAANEIVSNYTDPYSVDTHGPSSLNMTAIGRGLEAATNLAFNYALMIRALRWLAQAFPPYKWIKFQFFVLLGGPPPIAYIPEFIAEGSYEPFINFDAAGHSLSAEGAAVQPISGASTS